MGTQFVEPQKFVRVKRGHRSAGGMTVFFDNATPEPKKDFYSGFDWLTASELEELKEYIEPIRMQ